MRNVVKRVQDKLIERGYPKLDIADIQAIVWYNEKDLYRQYKAVNKSSEKTDYETAAQEVLREQGVNAEVALPFKTSKSSADGGRKQTDRIQPKSLSEKVEDAPQSRKQKAYPLEDIGKWYGDADYKRRGGELVYMTPDEFLSKAKPLKMDEDTQENIDDLVSHIEDGRKLDPLTLYSLDKTDVRSSDGRHRAYAAKELNINSVPVVDFTNSQSRKQQDAPSIREQKVYRAGDLTNKAEPIFRFDTRRSTGHFGTGFIFSVNKKMHRTMQKEQEQNYLHELLLL